jgi:hypothetical protein
MSRDRRIDLFVEDRAHEHFIRPLVVRLAREEEKSVNIQIRCSAGGHGRAIAEFKKYLALLGKKILEVPDLIVVGIDANCDKPAAKAREILDAGMTLLPSAPVVACPDPHIERWYMADTASFHRTVGSTPRVKRKKCERDYYKTALAGAIRSAGHPPTLSGLEFAEELANAMDLYAAGRTDRSFALFIDGLRSAMRRL